MAAVITLAVLRRPHRRPSSNQAATLESQITQTIQYVPGQTLRETRCSDSQESTSNEMLPLDAHWDGEFALEEPIDFLFLWIMREAVADRQRAAFDSGRSGPKVGSGARAWRETLTSPLPNLRAMLPRVIVKAGFAR
jgi:hypothetical protein